MSRLLHSLRNSGFRTFVPIFLFFARPVCSYFRFSSFSLRSPFPPPFPPTDFSLAGFIVFLDVEYIYQFVDLHISTPYISLPRTRPYYVYVYLIYIYICTSFRAIFLVYRSSSSSSPRTYAKAQSSAVRNAKYIFACVYTNCK